MFPVLTVVQRQRVEAPVATSMDFGPPTSPRGTASGRFPSKDGEQMLRWPCIALAGLWILFAFFTLVAKNPLRVDEVDYFQSMNNVVELGLPIYYAGEVELHPRSLNWLSDRSLAGNHFDFYRFKSKTGIRKETFFAITDGKSLYTFGMWHPPLYIYLGSFVFRVFPLTPDNSHLLRYFNLLWSLGLLVGMALLCRQLYPDHQKWVFPLALLLYASNSLALRGSLLIDYNAALGPCVAVWFLLA